MAKHKPRLNMSGRQLLAPEVEARIIATRVRRHFGPHRLAPLLGLPCSTIGKILVRHGFARLSDADKSTGAPIRYVREHPGELLHQDYKKLEPIMPGGSHRFLGRHRGIRNRGGAARGYDHCEVIVVDAGRVTYVAHVLDERPVRGGGLPR